MTERDFFATAARGTEPALRDELRELRLHAVRADRGGVHFQGAFEDAWRACLHSRVALRVLWPLTAFECPGQEALYDGVRAVDWTEHLSPRHSLAVSAYCRDSGLTHTNFAAQKTKDAIVDQLRERLGERPSVDRHDPDVQLYLHLVRDRATLYLDLVGESLHRRGYRVRTTDAPLKETLAAALLRLSGWDREAPLCDPMCGSGTIAIEAALWGRRIAPGLLRPRFGFERWPRFDATRASRLAELRAEARARILPEGPAISAADIDPRVLDCAKANARAAGVRIAFARRSALELEPLTPPGFVVSNPPYGQRLKGGRRFYVDLGRALQKLSGHRVGLLLASRDDERALGLRTTRYQLLSNGDIPCRFAVFELC